MDGWQARGRSSIQDAAKHASIATIVLLAAMVAWLRWREPETPQKPQASYSVLALGQMQAFRWYSGFFIMMWLPYLIAQEGEHMWGSHQAAFMAVCKLIFGLSIAVTPLFGALNDRTRLRFGRRRAWFFGGAVMIIVGMCCTVFASVWRFSGMFFLSLTLWMFGESACDCTSEALVPDLVPKEDFSRAGGFKSALFSLGGMFGYVLIIVFGVALRLPFYWIYFAFLFCILITAPFVFAYTAPTEAEMARLGGESREDDPPLLQSLWYSYVFPLQGRDAANFRTAVLASAFYCAGASSILFVLLVCRDIIRPGTPAEVQLHFAGASLTFCLFAVVGSLLASYAADSATRLRWGKIVGLLYGASELLIPACGHLLHPVAPFYAVSAIKGGLYGNILGMFYALQWDCLPARLREPDKSGRDHIAVTMGVASLARSLGAGLGNAFFGLVLQFAFSLTATEPTQDGTHDFHYSVASYYAMFSAAAVCTWTGTLLLQRIDLDSEKEPAA